MGYGCVRARMDVCVLRLKHCHLCHHKIFPYDYTCPWQHDVRECVCVWVGSFHREFVLMTTCCFLFRWEEDNFTTFRRKDVRFLLELTKLGSGATKNGDSYGFRVNGRASRGRWRKLCLEILNFVRGLSNIWQKWMWYLVSYEYCRFSYATPSFDTFLFFQTIICQLKKSSKQCWWIF